MRIVLERLLVIAGFLVLWEIAAAHVIDPYYVSSPSRIASDLADGFVNGTLTTDIMVTLTEAGLGLVLGMVTGVAVGLVFAFYRHLDAVFEPFMATLNSIPRPALAPLAILWFGLGIGSKVFVAWSLVFFVAFYNTYEGIKSIDPGIVSAVKIMRPSRWQMLRMVILPAVFSWVFAAFRLSVAYALIGAIVGEFVGATAGLGYQLTAAQGLLNTDRVFSVLVVTAVVAAVALGISQRVENKVLRWRPKVQVG